jgi:tetratricopeptide (TPR) repeat protein
MNATLLFFLVVIATIPPSNRVEEANTLLEKGHFAQVKALLESTSTSPRETGTQFLLGKIYFWSEDFSRAEELFQKATEAGPDNSDYFLWLGRAVGRRAEQASPIKAPFLARRARNAFTKSVELNPDNLESRDDLLTYYLEAPGFLGGGKDKAIELVEQIKSPHYCHYLRQWAQIYESEKAFEKAESALQKAVELKPACLTGFLALAAFYQSRSDVNKARATLLKTIQLFPKSPAPHFELGRFEVEAGGDLERGRLELDAFLGLHAQGEPYPFEGHYWLGRIQLALNRPAEAIDEFERALKDFPGHMPSQKGLAEARKRAKDPMR